MRTRKGGSRTPKGTIVVSLIALFVLAVVVDRQRRDDELLRSPSSPLADAASFCDGHSKIYETGAWCLKEWNPPRKFGKGGRRRLPKHHFPADEGVARKLINMIGDASVSDLGAGVGQYGIFFEDERRVGSYVAVDGALNVEEFTDGYVKRADLSRPVDAPADWVLSLEVGEHVPAVHERAYLDNLAKNARVAIVLSWAVPGQPGHGHVNAKSGEEVERLLNERGFYLDRVDTAEIRASVTTLKYLENTLAVYRRRRSPFLSLLRG